MFFRKRVEFEVKHSGRGGTVSFTYDGNMNSFNIEMCEKGNFVVFTGRESRYAKVRVHLREFLDRSDRNGWFIDE